MNAEAKKAIVSRDQLMADVRAHMKGGNKPLWAGQASFVGERAVDDWVNAEKSAVAMNYVNTFSKLVSDNHDLLSAINDSHPNSVKELADLIHRAESNVSRSLTKLEAVGVVILAEIEGSRAKRPMLAMRKVILDFDILDLTVSMVRARPKEAA
jgi:predicted transcriptional regulator